MVPYILVGWYKRFGATYTHIFRAPWRYKDTFLLTVNGYISCYTVIAYQATI
jgi:hypothetical protein